MDPRGSQQDDSASLDESLDTVQGKTTMVDVIIFNLNICW